MESFLTFYVISRGLETVSVPNIGKICGIKVVFSVGFV
jgi:hypothetical protein